MHITKTEIFVIYTVSFMVIFFCNKLKKLVNYGIIFKIPGGGVYEEIIKFNK